MLFSPTRDKRHSKSSEFDVYGSFSSHLRQAPLGPVTLRSLFREYGHINNQSKGIFKLILNLELDGNQQKSAEPKPLTIAIFWQDHLETNKHGVEGSLWLVWVCEGAERA